ncbi:MAG: DNA-primase RepB domain-containing protein [Candidatus Binataceae bacterium]
MTEEERKNRGQKSTVIVERLVRVQLRAMGCERFDLGIRREAGEMILREGQGSIEVEEAIKWLRHENAKGAHIYIRPAGTHSLSLIDDLAVESIERMKPEGFEPAVVVETSPNNFQAWLNHGQVLEAALSTRVAKVLVERFGGDPSSADWRHFGRLAGYTNPKRERQLPSGLRPFARLRSATGRVYSKAAEFLADIRSNDERRAAHEQETRRRPQRRRERGVKPLKEFQSDPIYAGDLHRADMAWSKHAAGCGLTFEQIKDELLNGRDLGKKGSRKRQVEYAERTARKAIELFALKCRGKTVAR